jgi:putative redox protein
VAARSIASRARSRLEGDLTPEQRSRLLAIANKCPMYRTLQSDIRIDSLLADPNAAAAPE